MTQLHSDRVVLVLSPMLGDSLLLMTIANNLRRMGRAPIIYGAYIEALAIWFPGFDIRPLPTPQELHALGQDAWVVQMDRDKPYSGLADHCPGYVCIKDWEASARREQLDPSAPNSILAAFKAFSETILGVRDWTLDNGMRPSANLTARAQSQRVILHPTSSEAGRCWSPHQYVKLAIRLQRRGFEPLFVLAPSERPAWRPLLSKHGLSILEAPDLAQTTAAVYESGWFIGNDSGIGHIASACGVPTITIVERLRNMNRFRPAWSPSMVVRPWWLPFRAMRRKYWRQATTVGRVLNTFEKMRKKIERDRQQGKLPTGVIAYTDGDANRHEAPGLSDSATRSHGSTR